MTDNTLEKHKALIYLRLQTTARCLNQILVRDIDIKENLT